MERVLSLHNHPRAAVLADWLTVERVSYGVMAVAALGLRLWGLGAVPLGPAEAVQAWPAVVAAGGRAPDLAGISPLLYTLQRALFMLFGASDSAARWGPALLGGLAPLLFYALRTRLTRGGALVAACLWALSPLAVWSGRLAVGDAFVPPLTLALLAAIVVALNGASDAARRRGLVAGAVALGLLLISGRLAYTALLALAVGLAWWPGGARRLLAAAQSQRRSVLAGALVTLALGATFFTVNLAGLASAGDLLSGWLGALFSGAGDYSAWDQARRLLLSEPLLLGFGLAGLIWSLRRGDRFGQWAGIATGSALLLALLGRGRHPLDLTLVALWLTLLAGPAVARVLRAAWSWRREADPWLLVGLSMALLFSAAISLVSATTSTNNAAWRQVYTGVGIVTALASVLIWLAYGAYGNWRTVARAWPIIPLALGLAWTVSQTAALSYDRGAWRQSAITREVVAPAATDFRAALHQLSALTGSGARETAVDLAWPARSDEPLLPVVRWQLRDFPYLRVSAAVPADPAPIVVTPVEDQPRLSERYSGAEFALLHRWQPDQLEGFSAILRWVLYREARTPPEALKVLLWVDRTTE